MARLVVCRQKHARACAVGTATDVVLIQFAVIDSRGIMDTYWLSRETMCASSDHDPVEITHETNAASLLSINVILHRRASLFATWNAAAGEGPYRPLKPLRAP
jgi:hypothetical protein